MPLMYLLTFLQDELFIIFLSSAQKQNKLQYTDCNTWVVCSHTIREGERRKSSSQAKGVKALETSRNPISETDSNKQSKNKGIKRNTTIQEENTNTLATLLTWQDKHNMF